MQPSVLGKRQFYLLKKRFYKIFKNKKVSTGISKFRHYFGLVLLLGSGIPLYLNAYFIDLRPEDLMKLGNKTRYAILGMLLEKPSSGYEIKSFAGRSTVYFWRESDSTIYPMLKLLAKEGKVLSHVHFIGKKKKEVFSITDAGRAEFQAWIKSPTGEETPRNEFLLKLFFITDEEEMIRLFQERLEKVEMTYEKYKQIEERLESFADSPRKKIRLKLLGYGIAQLAIEIQWLKEGILEHAHY